MARSLPEGFPPADKSYALYEGIEYQGFWETPELERQDALERHVLRAMLPRSGHRILDLGGGYGRLAPCYLDRFDQIVLCDGSLSLLRDAHDALGDRALLVAADVARLPFKAASFDCVLSIRVLQHVHDLRGTLDEARRVTADGGAFVFSYHNKRNIKEVARHFAARGDASPFSHAPTEPVPTLISRHPDSVEAAVRDAGFSAPRYEGTAVVHALAGITERLGRRRPAGAWWAPFMGRFRLAPWLIGLSLARGGGPLCEGRVADVFQCPLCHGELEHGARGLTCPACHRDYPTDGGITDLRV